MNRKDQVPLSPRDMVRSGLCIGCGSCVAQAGAAVRSDAHMRLNWYGQLRPSGSAEWLRRSSESLAQTCPFSPSAANETRIAADLYPEATHRDPLIGRFQTAYVGYAAEGSFREWGSSGGMVSWAAAEL